MPAEAIKTVNTDYSLESHIVVDNTVPLVLTFDKLNEEQNYAKNARNEKV
jgi:predicted dinucleotide-binding enzyme